jgi:hypothetical protein
MTALDQVNSLGEGRASFGNGATLKLCQAAAPFIAVGVLAPGSMRDRGRRRDSPACVAFG